MSQFPRIEQLLGGRLDHVGYHQIAALVDNPNAAEGIDLDFKGFDYKYVSPAERNKPEAERKDWGDELAKDVSSFANGRGGVIVLGMHEVNGVPSCINPFPLKDKDRRDYQDVVAARTEPRVHFATHPVPNPDKTSEGFLLLVVPRSLQGPHAAHGIKGKRKDGYIRCPVRTDSGTTFLSQSQNLEAAMQRISTLDRRKADRDALELQVAREAFATTPEPSPRLLLSLMPAVPGEMDLNTRSLATFTRELLAEPLWLAEDGHTFDDVTPCSSGLSAEMYSEAEREINAILGTDGTGALAYQLRTSPNSTVTFPGRLPPTTTVSPGELCGMVLTALGVLARHAADRAATLGACDIQMRVVVSLGEMPGTPMAAAPTPADEPVALGFDGSQTHAFASAGAVVESLTVPGTHLVQTAHKLLTKIAHCFGQAESPFTTAEGALVRDQRNSFFPSGRLYRWAEESGLEIVTHPR
ncbi:AlbA family DNA-binding domain-containing protein [Kitasatospora sp. NPDC003701]